MENLEHIVRQKTRLRWFVHVLPRDKNSIFRRAMELEMEGRNPVSGSKKSWGKVVEEDRRKLNIAEDIAEEAT